MCYLPLRAVLLLLLEERMIVQGLLGFKVLQLDKKRMVLRSPAVTTTVWDTRIVEAMCETEDHKAPHKDCACGIYGTLLMGELFRYYSNRSDVFAIVAGSGKYIRGECGWRSQYAEIVNLISPQGWLEQFRKIDFSGRRAIFQYFPLTFKEEEQILTDTEFACKYFCVSCITFEQAIQMAKDRWQLFGYRWPNIYKF